MALNSAASATLLTAPVLPVPVPVLDFYSVMTLQIFVNFEFALKKLNILQVRLVSLIVQCINKAVGIAGHWAVVCMAYRSEVSILDRTSIN